MLRHDDLVRLRHMLDHALGEIKDGFPFSVSSFRLQRINSFHRLDLLVFLTVGLQGIPQTHIRLETEP